VGLLDLFRRDAAAPRASRREHQLFDDEFQRKLEMLALVSRRVFAGRLRAERRSKKKGSGIEFADHRDYVAGDDFRSVDWNVYQRFGKLLVRLYEEEEDLSIYLLVDCSTSMGFGNKKKFDQARRLCAALAYVGLANLDRVTVVGVNDGVISRMPTTRGKGRIFKVFEFLSKLERGLAVLFSDLYDPAGFEAGINMLRFNKFEPYVVELVDPSESRPALKGDVRIYDCETGEERELTVTDGMLDKMQQAALEYRASIERFCVQKQVPYFPADVNTPFDELVLRVFRRGGFLR
jgi:uncharacterized protein (DUF58 family)